MCATFKEHENFCATFKEHENFHTVQREKKELETMKKDAKKPIKSLFGAFKKLDKDKKIAKKEKELTKPFYCLSKYLP